MQTGRWVDSYEISSPHLDSKAIKKKKRQEPMDEIAHKSQQQSILITHSDGIKRRVTDSTMHVTDGTRGCADRGVRVFKDA